jgi:hypothetical protein
MKSSDIKKIQYLYGIRFDFDREVKAFGEFIFVKRNDKMSMFSMDRSILAR